MSETRRAAWAWRRYVSAAGAGAKETVRYESLLADMRSLSPVLGCSEESLADAFASFRASSIGRWRDDLSPEQLADVEAEAGDLLAELGYTLNE